MPRTMKLNQAQGQKEPCPLVRPSSGVPIAGAQRPVGRGEHEENKSPKINAGVRSEGAVERRGGSRSRRHVEKWLVAVLIQQTYFEVFVYGISWSVQTKKQIKHTTHTHFRFQTYRFENNPDQ